MNKNVTIVTGLWDLGRENIEGWGKRSFQQYKDKFFELLKTDANLAIWIPKNLENDVWAHRETYNTKVYIKNVEDFKEWNPFFEQIQNIRTDEAWVNSAGWLTNAPQAKLEYYNAMMFTKMFMLHDTSIYNPFNSEYFYWIDGGITSTVNQGYFTTNKVFDNLEHYTKSINKFCFITYPYTANNEIHGFERTKLAEYCNTDFVNYVSRGGFFGGKKEHISTMNSIYYGLMEKTLNEGYMGADECLFTILAHTQPNLVERFEIESNGLIWPFFEKLKEYEKPIIKRKKTNNQVALYVLTFNSPKQVKTLIKSMEEYDNNFVIQPKWFLLDNSTDLTTTDYYMEICEQYDITHIKKDNIGICGGRQFIAEHAEKNGFKYYFFFEDDMFFFPKKGTVCKNGFNRFVPDLYNKSINIMNNEKYDFLKLSFTEFYGDNKTQWSWYNVSQNIREKIWPDYPKLPKHGLDPNAPKTKFNNIMTRDGLSYVDGEIYYCNWPQIVSANGNQKMFLNETWAHPYEQTWMSYIYQETIKGNIKPALLLLTPTEHNRFDYYDGKLRRES